jgi:cyclophilin family peptidyl-prolyl cis-trans isomerase
LNNETYVGGEEQFLEWAQNEFRYTDKSMRSIYKKLASDAHRVAINETPGRSYVYMCINTGASVASKVVIELFEDICPKTCENFKSLCESVKKHGSEEKIGYVNTDFHRVVKGMYVQGGSLTKTYGESATGYSIYGGEFNDESFDVKHTEPGLLGMCKRSGIPNTNDTQFYVTTGAPLTFMDGENVIFGRVIEGYRVFKLIEKMDTVNEKPTPGVTIETSGVYKLEKLNSKESTSTA